MRICGLLSSYQFHVEVNTFEMIFQCTLRQWYEPAPCAPEGSWSFSTSYSFSHRTLTPPLWGFLCLCCTQFQKAIGIQVLFHNVNSLMAHFLSVGRFLTICYCLKVSKALTLDNFSTLINWCAEAAWALSDSVRPKKKWCSSYSDGSDDITLKLCQNGHMRAHVV